MQNIDNEHDEVTLCIKGEILSKLDQFERNMTPAPTNFVPYPYDTLNILD